MLQRVQTVFLFIITALSVLLAIVPFQKVSTYEITFLVSVKPDTVPGMTKSLILFPVIINHLIAVLALITIFLFKNRKMQMKLCTVIALVSVLLTALLYVFNYVEVQNSNDSVTSFYIGSYFPIAMIVFSILSRIYIKKDEELVRSADRIR